jgi:hypothetical protein
MTQLKKGGFSVSMDGKSPKSGYMTAFTDKTEVKIDPEQVTRKDILSFIMNNARELRKPNRYFGGWVGKDKQGNTWVYLDVSQNLFDLDGAMQMARAAKQEAIYDVVNDTSLYLSDYYTDYQRR